MSYDVVIIGSGPGGYSAAVRAGQYGLKTAIIEKSPKLGGTCLHVGCIPTKALLHSASVWDYFVHPEEEGISCQSPVLHFPNVIDRKAKIVSKHAKGVEFLMKKNKVDVIAGYAKLLGGGKIEVSHNGQTQIIESKNIVIATGSEARMIPNVQPQSPRILTNVEILDLPSVPKSLAIIGAGAVGVEFASIFRRFGSEVTIFEMLPRVVPVEDEEVSKELERCFKKMGIRIETSAKVENIVNGPNSVKFTATLANGSQEQVEVESLLVAVGRKPNTESIGLENTKVEVDRGFLKVNGFQQTSEPGVYAIGDVVAGTPQLAHVATAEGMIAIGHIAGVEVQPIRRNRIPGATYTDPGIGSVGLTESQAKAQGYKVKVGKFPFAANSKASISGHHEGFVKVVADDTYGEILGVHIIGHHGYELIAEAVAAMESESTVEVMMNTIHAHPTLYEAVGEAFNAVYGMAINA
ncbi:dihydrolipoyl dehydrogenase [Bryobacter aggregatus]|uniref:dihydrolipoyl dehydrogenase n=1 Tax=Bryobacter aggregatus TaxID=360054 RepID=UPI0004E149EA|nr:dihydrolipoyl dehydrogenase [Bryobacter aggregatus]